MADANTAVYAVVDKTKKKTRTPPKKYVANLPEGDTDSPPVPVKNEELKSEYPMASLDSMYSSLSHDVSPTATPQVNVGTEQQRHDTSNKITRNIPPKERFQIKGTGYKVLASLLLIIAVVAILIICIAILFAEVANLKKTSVEQNNKVITTLDNHTDRINDINQLLNTSAIDIYMLRRDFSLVLGQSESLPLPSCAVLHPSSPSDYYWVRASNGSAVRVYCDMTLSCGNIAGGWMRVAELDFNKTAIMCPRGLKLLQQMGARTCSINSTKATCASVLFSTSGVTYDQVCGKVLAYQVDTPDAFGIVGLPRKNSTIDGNYVDGVSLTHGTGPRKHIWTFAAALDEYGGVTMDREICQCSTPRHLDTSPPAFVGQDYFCDSGKARFTPATHGLLTTSPLWDGAGCGPDSTCCTFNNPPWFHKQLPSPTSDDIEMRVCRDQERDDEDIAISSAEIYIR